MSSISSEKWVKVIDSNVETNASPEDIRASVQKSLDALTFIPDLFLIHNPYIPSKAGVSIAHFWQQLEGMVEDGMLKGCSLGISNFRPVDVEEVMKIAKIKPVVNREALIAGPATELIQRCRD